MKNTTQSESQMKNPIPAAAVLRNTFTPAALGKPIIKPHRSVLSTLMVALFGGFLLSASTAQAATVTVTSTADVAANDGQCTLREAIIATNTNTVSGVTLGECVAGAAGLDTIAFAIAGAGVRSITLAALLPTITEAVFINGYTQPGTSANTNPLNAGINAVLLIEVTVASGPSQLTINASGTTIRGIVFNRGGDEIRVAASNVTIAGNFIGTNAAGTAANGNPAGGYAIRQDSGNNNVIGGPGAADSNLLSGDTQGAVSIDNGDGTLIQGNYIGTDITGTVSLNGTGSRTGVTIRGPVVGATSNTAIFGNLISGNSGGGVVTTSAGGLLLQGNLIGTQRDGVSALGNGQAGVYIPAGTGNAVGGTSPGQGNSIAFNQGFGVWLAGANSFTNSVRGNSIYSNTMLGITLASSATPLANDACDVDINLANRGQNYPVITSAAIAAGNVTISGTLNSVASTSFRIEFFSNVSAHPSGNGEGQTFLGFTNVMTDAGCNASFGPLVFAVPPGQTIFSATATDPDGIGNTSEFSVAFPPAAAVLPPTISKSFGAMSIPLNGSTSLSFTISNPNGATALSGIGFTDLLPTGLVVSTPNGLSGSCGGGTITASAGSGAVSLTGASLAGSAACTFNTNVTGTVAGTKNNVTGPVSSVAGGSGGTASASVTVAGAGPAPTPPVTIPTLQQSALWLLGLLMLIATAAVSTRQRKPR